MQSLTVKALEVEKSGEEIRRKLNAANTSLAGIMDVEAKLRYLRNSNSGEASFSSITYIVLISYLKRVQDFILGEIFYVIDSLTNKSFAFFYEFALFSQFLVSSHFFGLPCFFKEFTLFSAFTLF